MDGKRVDRWMVERVVNDLTQKAARLRVFVDEDYHNGKMDDDVEYELSLAATHMEEAIMNLAKARQVLELEEEKEAIRRIVRKGEENELP